jgi:hypothetical protein
VDFRFFVAQLSVAFCEASHPNHVVMFIELMSEQPQQFEFEENLALYGHHELKAPNEWHPVPQQVNPFPTVRDTAQIEFYKRWRAGVASEVDVVMPIPPLREIISQYADFIRM